MKFTRRNVLVGILVLAFVLTIGYAFYFRIQPVVDAQAYDIIAVNLLQGKGYVENPDLPIVLDSAVGRVGPGYQFFLFLVYGIFGHSYEIVWLLQALMHIGSALMLFLLAGKIFKENGEIIGIIAATFYAFFVDVFQMAGMLLAETFFIFIIMATIYLFVRYFDQSTTSNATWLGVVTALAILTRPTVLFFLLVFVIFALVKRRYKEAVIIILCSLFIIGPWVLRNYNVYHRFIGTTAAGGVDLWAGNNPEANGELQFTPEMEQYLKDYGIVEASRRGFKEASSFAVSHPLQLFKLQLIKTSIYFSAGRPSAFWFHLSGPSKIITIIASSLFAFTLFVAGLAGAWLLWRKREPLFRWLLAMALALPIAVIPIVVETRYRFPIYPFLALFAGYFVVSWLSKLKNKEYFSVETKVLLVTFFIIAANTGFDVFRNLGTVFSKLGM